MADKSWHLTSPTPYDPPLTYGGWTQSRALGTRIANLLDARAEKLAVAAQTATSNVEVAQESGEIARKRKRKHRVVLHSSPFLRCVQTSIAIGAGIAQYQGGEEVERKRRRRNSTHDGVKPSRIKHTIEEEEEEEDPAVSAATEEHGEPSPHETLQTVLKQPEIEKSILRVDAFLGEWMSPEYYTDIMPPPESTLMIASAKAELLRNEPIDLFQPTAAARGHFPGGWNLTGNSTDDADAHPPSPGNGDTFSGLSALGHALPRRDRASSHSSAGSILSRKGHKGSRIVTTTKTFYSAPIPAYAVSTSEPIPRGYVAHAREACIDVDFQWDSMREPQNWGDGGEYGEEWSAMHKRFRIGLYRLISWYKEHGIDDCPHAEEAISGSSAEEDEEDYDLVLVLVTHGAGCNALIGAITNQPVLIDVGTASLTMAVRRSEATNGLNQTNGIGGVIEPPPTRRSSVDFGLSQEYEIQILASSDHLRSGSETAALSALQSPKIVPQIPEYRAGHKAASQSLDDGLKSRSSMREATRPVNSALGSIRRSSTMSSSSRRYDSASPSRTSNAGSATGLWSRTPTTPATLDSTSDLSASPPKEFSLPPALHGKSPVAMDKESDSEKDDVAPLKAPIVGRSMSGLWGGNGADSSNAQQIGPKRRWTVNDRDP